MGMKKNRLIVGSIFIIMLIVASLTSVYSLGSNDRDEFGSPNEYFTVYEQGTNKEVFSTGWIVTKGDRYLSEDNKMYEVVKVEAKNNKAYAKFLEDIKLPDIQDYLVEESFFQDGEKRGRLGIYHTHSSESYVPSDGSESIMGNGGIFKVGDSLRDSLEQRGIDVDFRRTPHDPHDAGAYKRSRNTALDIIKGGSDAILDLHRDAIPKEQYIKDLNEEPISKVRIVIGRRNQNAQANEQLAHKIKAIADEKYPGLIKDIFYARGDYNQDLTPRALLFEMGTYEHTRERAERSTEYFADVLATTFYGGPLKTQEGEQVKVTPATQDNRGSGRGILIALLVVGLGGAGFLFLSTGGKEIWSKMGNFKQEFSNFLGRNRKNRK